MNANSVPSLATITVASRAVVVSALEPDVSFNFSNSYQCANV